MDTEFDREGAWRTTVNAFLAASSRNYIWQARDLDPMLDAMKAAFFRELDAAGRAAREAAAGVAKRTADAELDARAIATGPEIREWRLERAKFADEIRVAIERLAAAPAARTGGGS